MLPESVTDNLPRACLTDRLSHISLMPHDVGGSGDCFFKSVSHQLFGTADLHFQIRMSGIAHLNSHPEFYIESISNNCWENYVQQMSTPGTWCDNIIIQAVANAHNCVIHITESDINKPEGTIITPIFLEERPMVIFIGYINELHYVSTVAYKNSLNKSRLVYLKRKLSESDDEKGRRLAKRRNSTSTETDEERQKRLARLKENELKRRAEETDAERQKRLARQKENVVKRRAEETDNERKKRLAKLRENDARRRADENIEKKQERLEEKKNQKSKQSNNTIHENFNKPIMEQTQVLKNIDLFHECNQYSVKQCIVCLEAWP